MGGLHLSPRGVSLAREVGRASGRFDRVVTSPKPRAVETARAMGYEVDAELSELEEVPEEVAHRLDERSPTSFAEYAELVRSSREAATYAAHLARTWLAELERVPDGGRLLLISHSGIIELGTAGAVGAAVEEWGPGLGFLEGVQLERLRGRWGRAEVLRVR